MSENSLSKRGGAGGAGGTGRRSPFSGGGPRKNASTMNNPEAGVLNSSATKTVAAMAFAKQQESEHKSAPAIATGYIPPVLEKHEEVKASPFKAAPKPPIKRPRNLGQPGAGGDNSAEDHKSESSSAGGPGIAQFIPVPVIEKPKSPFVPLEEKPAFTGFKAPVRSKTSPFGNSAQTDNQTSSSPLDGQGLGAAGSSTRKSPLNPAFKKTEVRAVEEKPKVQTTADKTFIPLAPVPVFAKKDDINPFAAPVEKTEEQRRKEEAAAAAALEQSRSAENKKSRLDRLMDELNKPLF